MNSPHLKEWMTVAEIANARIAGLPDNKRGVARHVIESGWNNEPLLHRKRLIRPVSLTTDAQTQRINRVAPYALNVLLSNAELGQIKAAAKRTGLSKELVATILVRNALNICAVLP